MQHKAALHAEIERDLQRLDGVVAAARRGEFATGLLYIEPDRDDFLTQLNVVDEPLATLPLERVRPGRESLDEIMEGLR